MEVEQVLTNLMCFATDKVVTVGQLKEDNVPNDYKLVPLDFLQGFVGDTQEIYHRQKQEEKELEKHKQPIKRFLFVEDGTVDIDELQKSLDLSNPEIKIVVYRQGSQTPQFVEV